jgi:RNA-directed DNA polymerase
LNRLPEEGGYTKGAEPRIANRKNNALQTKSMLEEILDRRNIEKALCQVETNKGAGGIDNMKWDELRPYINTNWQYLRGNISEGKYKPGPVRKVVIPKPQGGSRNLGIPTVVDRMIQQAISPWLTIKYEENFSSYSYGFRPNRNAHQAVQQAAYYLNSGKTWVIELDLENFFDKVNHDRLMSLLAKQKPNLFAHWRLGIKPPIVLGK